MPRPARLLLLTASFLAAMPALAQVPAAHSAKDDPANLAGERVQAQALADTLPLDHGAPALQQLLLKLRTRASMMLIVAHPDDEDGGLLTYESRGAGARVAMLTLTRGEGGQNLMSADFNDALGLIRTQELLAADRYMGVDQLFGTEVDFGFSKTKEETLKQWTHDRVLYDAVRAVRLYRPLVLASVFVGGPTDGHGHHQVAGEICQEVFLAAADPKIFPEMNLPPWAPRKVYARVPFSRVGPEGMYDYATGKTVPLHFHNYVTGQDTSSEPQPTVLIHEGDPAVIGFGAQTGKQAGPALGMDGMSYVQWARQGLAQQKTQLGPTERLAPAGKLDAGYTLMASRTGPVPAQEPSLFTGIDTSLPALAQLAPSDPKLASTLSAIDAQLALAQQRFDPENIELTAPPLRDALRALDELIATTDASTTLPATERFNLLHELRIKRVQLNDALALAHHLTLSAALTEPVGEPQLLTTTNAVATSLTLHNESANSLRLISLQLTVNTAEEGIADPHREVLEPRTTRSFPIRLPYVAGLAATRPYFSRPTLEQPFYTITQPELRNAPATPPPFRALAVLDDQGVQIRLAAIVPAPGAPSAAIAQAAVLPQALVVVPPVSVALSRNAGIVSSAQPTVPLSVTLRTLSHPVVACPAAGITQSTPKSGRPEGKLQFDLPAGWSSDPEQVPFDPHCVGDETYAFKITATAEKESGTLYKTAAVARFSSHNYAESFRAVGYPGLTYTNLYTPAVFRAAAVEVKTAPNLRIGYLPGTGDAVPAYLPNLGITPTLLTVGDLNAATLDRFDAVLLGVRAYAAHPELAGAGSRPLLDYAAQGGVVIVQYNTADLGDAEAPYPISVPGDSAHNVVEEAQPVTLLEPDAPLLTWPNRITPADFNGWVEERGHGFAASWSPRYRALLETSDTDQEPQRGGLLVAPVGKGAWIYLSFALYRQLPEAVPGAYRLLANLLSFGHNPQR